MLPDFERAAALQLAEAYEEGGEHDMANKLATDALRGGDRATRNEAREFLRHGGGDDSAAESR